MKTYEVTVQLAITTYTQHVEIVEADDETEAGDLGINQAVLDNTEGGEDWDAEVIDLVEIGEADMDDEDLDAYDDVGDEDMVQEEFDA